MDAETLAFIMAAAQQLGAYYKQLLIAGFTETQAFELTLHFQKIALSKEEDIDE